VVVINFLNERNAADRRVLELLTEKFQLFSGVFGSSDEVLGTIESGMDFEKRILAIYQTCRTPEMIEAAFQDLRAEMDAVIAARMDATRRALLEHFDEDVHARLRLQLDSARAQLDYVGRLFWMLTCYMLRETARFDEPSLSFHLHTPPRPDLPRGNYQLIGKGPTLATDVQLYRLSHPLGAFVLESARGLPTPPAALRFIKALNRQARLATNLDAQRAIQEKLRELERLQRRQRQRIFDVEDEMKERRDQLISALERCLSRRTAVETLFTLRWAVA
jgi:exonuclease VII large subunit